MDLSNSLGTLRSQKKTKLDSFRRRDRMVKQITPPRDIPFLKSGLSLVGGESTAKLEVQVICGFFVHYVSVKK